MLPYPNHPQDTRNLAQYDSRDLMTWNTRISGGLQTEMSPPIPQLTEENLELFHRSRDSDFLPPMNSSHKHRMPHIPALHDELENVLQATKGPATHRCLVGEDGFPKPRPECEFKQKFTPDDDELLKHLKHDKKDPYRLGSKDDSLTWRQIADFFPGRAPGTLQVHYCKEVGAAKAPEWTEELDDRLKDAMEEYEKERWQVIAKRFKGKNYAAACEERAQWLQELYLRGERPVYPNKDKAEAQGQQQTRPQEWEEDEERRDQEQEMEERERDIRAKKRKTQGKKRKMKEQGQGLQMG
ncbi:hypothetical protein N7508_009238 [Penicillium antarcticum]|uniref:uncharacterized protein n=1 Tax=Penicillium antarcticum TaxID=416450 RepID=UPI00238B265A|nr:uncharacterized protein N7508_009238 [Penicillium antarcticum]KAJ5294417.1 hypothetical protein N7508_009238 [Penicillium antarcticum]